MIVRAGRLEGACVPSRADLEPDRFMDWARAGSGASFHDFEVRRLEAVFEWRSPIAGSALISAPKRF